MRPPLHFLVRADDFGSADKTSGAGTKPPRRAGTKPPRRALKAMRKSDQVLAELNGREGLGPKYYMARSNPNTLPHTPLHGI